MEAVPDSNQSAPQPSMQTVNLRIPREELARLDFLLAKIRSQTGVFIGRSGAMRALVTWLARMNIGIQEIQSSADLEARLARMLRPRAKAGTREMAGKVKSGVRDIERTSL